MSMSRRNSRVNYPSRRTVDTPIYESFEPKSEMKQQDGALLILLHLPGFIKEQVKFTTDESSNYIRVNGERGLGNRRRIRFNKEFTVPQNYDLNQLQTNFEIQNGIFGITIPQKDENPISAKENVEEEEQQQQEIAKESKEKVSKREVYNVMKEVDNDEEKQAMVNSLVAILVILILGANIFYTAFG